MHRLVQLQKGDTRRIALVEEPRLRLLGEFPSVYALVQSVIASGSSLSARIQQSLTEETLGYDAIYQGKSEWRLLVPIDHPQEPARCMVSGTGLTHLGSAQNRNAMHEAGDAELTDSMRMFRWGVERGRPAAGKIGTAPEWFFKGTGAILRAHNEPLDVPTYAEDGGEEAEVAGAYIVGPGGTPHRVGFVLGNEFSDHRFEKKNYLNLAGSKLRNCSIGPELVIGHDFQSVLGKAAIHRGAAVVWSKDICTGEAEMCHSLQNIEHHHFKFESHRQPGDVHIHYFGACALSFGDGVQLQEGDVMEVAFQGLGRPLRNPLRVAGRQDSLVAITALA